MLRHRDLYPLFDDFADDLENYLTYVRLKTKYDTQNYWMDRIKLDCLMATRTHSLSGTKC